MYFNYLEKADPEITAAIKREINRQETKIEMIASENFVNYEIMEAAGSALTNKYAEGYPGKRYYGGCEFVDEPMPIQLYTRLCWNREILSWAWICPMEAIFPTVLR